LLHHFVLDFLLFALVCYIYLHFRFAYRIACRDGVDWFEISLNDPFAKHNSFHGLE